jgi:hypothetical protein
MGNCLLISIPALCAWRENRGGGQAGMRSVVNVLQNRAIKNNTSLYAEATKKEQFTSISPPPEMKAKESEADIWPVEGDPQYAVAEQMVNQALACDLTDITGGATLYYAADASRPDWNFAELTQTAIIAGQIFFKVKT